MLSKSPTSSGGLDKVAEIISQMEDKWAAKRMIREVAGGDRKIIDALYRKVMSLPKIISQLDDRDLQKALQHLKDRELSLMLKGLTEENRAKLLKNISKTRKDSISLPTDASKEEMDDAWTKFLKLIDDLSKKRLIAFESPGEVFEDIECVIQDQKMVDLGAVLLTDRECYRTDDPLGVIVIRKNQPCSSGALVLECFRKLIYQTISILWGFP